MDTYFSIVPYKNPASKEAHSECSDLQWMCVCVSDFRLYLQTELANPHFKPEIQAQTTIVNFAVTEIGLEEQLMALAVKAERPALEQQRLDLIEQQNAFHISLKQLEDEVIDSLANTKGDVLGDTTLIDNLESIKATVADIEVKARHGRTMQATINSTREAYRVVGVRKRSTSLCSVKWNSSAASILTPCVLTVVKITASARIRGMEGLSS